MESDKGCSSSSKENERTSAKDDPVLQRLVASNVIHSELFSSDDEFDLPYEDNDELTDDLEKMFFKEQIRNAKKLFFDITKESDDDMDDILDEIVKCPIKMSECLAQNSNLVESDLLNYLQDILETNSLMRDKLLILEQGLLKKRQELKDALSVLERQDLDLSEDENIDEENEEVVTSESPFYSPPKDGIVYTEHMGLFFRQFDPPYFKTRHGFMCPYNSDAVEEKNSNRCRVTDIVYKKPWTNHSLETLENVLKKCLVEEFKNRPDFKSIYKWKQYSAYVKSHMLAEILRDKEIKFDWLKVSVMMGDEENRSESECKKIWDLYLDTKYNKNQWAEDENKLITFLSGYYKEFEWEQIAKEMGSGRSRFQVFVHYQNELRKKQLCGLKWTSEEDEQIKRIIDYCKYGEFISWKKVVYYYEKRTYSQIYTRYYSYLLYDRKGKFSNQEDEAIISSVFEHKLRIKDAVKLLDNRRSEQQIRSRVKNVYDVIRSGKKVGEFTYEEDENLLRLVEDMGPKWTDIAKEMNSRDRTQLRHRYNKLKIKMDDPSFNLEKIDRTKRPIEKYLKKRHKRILDLIEKNENDVSKGKKKNCLRDLKRVNFSSRSDPTAVKKDIEQYFLNSGCFKWFPEVDGPPPDDCVRLASTFTSLLGARLSTDTEALSDESSPLVHLLSSLRRDPELFNACPVSTPGGSSQAVPVLPPNLLTCSGFTNLLDHCTEGVKVSYETPQTQSTGEQFELAKLLWKRRLFQLFLWPAILSSKAASSDELSRAVETFRNPNHE